MKKSISIIFLFLLLSVAFLCGRKAFLSWKMESFRQDHPLQHISNPVSDMNLRPLEQYLAHCDYVLLEYVEELGADSWNRPNHRFILKEIISQGSHTDWKIEDYIIDNNALEVFVSSPWQLWGLIPGEEYLFLVTTFNEEEKLELYPHHSFYVTSEQKLVPLSDEEEIQSYMGCFISDFEKQLPKKSINIPIEGSELSTQTNHYSKLTETEINVLRQQYPIVDGYESDGCYLVDSNWGANFATIFQESDVILTGTILSEVIPCTEKNKTIQLNEWNGSIEEMEALSKNRMQEISWNNIHAYFTFQIDEILWKREEKNLLIQPGDILLFAEGVEYTKTHSQLHQGQKYLWAADFNQVTGCYQSFRSSAFYMTEDGYLFSFQSGHHTNQYTGHHLDYYKEELHMSLLDPSRAGIPFH